MKNDLLILSFLLFIAVCTDGIFAQQMPASAIAEQRARAYIEALNSNNRAAWRKFIADNYTKAALERSSPEMRLESITRIYDVTRGLTLKGVRQTKPNEVTVEVISNLTGQVLEFSVQTEENASYQINLFGFNLQPKETFSAKKLSDKQIVSELSAFLKKLSAVDNFSGAVLLAHDDKILFEKAYGEANKDFHVANNVKTKFNLGSMIKMFTAVAIAQLVQIGKISFDDPLGKFLPDFPNKEAAEKIKIKHLLSHTSGLGSYFNEKFINSSRDNYRTIDDYLGLVKDDKPAFEPGTKWRYSNTGFLILGKIVEKTSGQNYFDYVREHIYKPAGMVDTDAYELDKVNPNLALGYEKEYTGGGIVFLNNLFLHVIKGGPAGGGYSTVEDLLKFAVALRAGKLINQGLLKTITSPKPELASPRYGYGFGVNSERGTVGHNGGFNGISSDLTMYLNSNYTAIALSNYGNASLPVEAKFRELIQTAQK